MRKLLLEIVQLLAAKVFFWALSKRVKAGTVETPEHSYQGMSVPYLIADHPRAGCVWQSYLMMVPLDRVTGAPPQIADEFFEGRMN